MNKAVFHVCVFNITLLVLALCVSNRSEAAQFSLDVAGAYSSNMERESDGEAGFFVFTRFAGQALLPQILNLDSQIGLILEDKHYQGGASAQLGELYVGGFLYRGNIIELSCTGSGTYDRDSLVPEDDFYAAALEPQGVIHLTPTLDLGVAYYVQWRNYADKVELPGTGGMRMEHASMGKHTPADKIKLETRREQTRRTHLGLTWVPRADMLITAAGTYSDNSASVAMERWYAWGGEMELIWELRPTLGVNLLGGVVRQKYPETRNNRADTIKHAGLHANYYLERGELYLGLEWERDSSNIAAETYSVRTITCGTRIYF
jgi:hypothetical protein